MMKRSGFTLAEVLITLGIIGVVAAMTIPNLIANTNGAKFRSQFKKTVSTLNQAGLMAQAQYDFDYAGTGAADAEGNGGGCLNGSSDHPESVMTFCSILNGTLTGQTYVGKPTAGDDGKGGLKRNANGKAVAYSWVSGGTLANGLALTDTLVYTLADGSIVGFHNKAGACELPIGTQMNAAQIEKMANCTGFIDVNGVTLPNKEVNCAGKATAAVDQPCAVKNSANEMTDVFPIVFHDATVEPASDAAKYVLTSSK